MVNKTKCWILKQFIKIHKYLVIKHKTTWPAVIFAARRNDKVIGRTIILIDSINTKNGFNHNGAPSGNKWAIKVFSLNINLDIIILIHSGNPITNVNNKWEEVENEKDINPSKFTDTKTKNNEIITIEYPFNT